MRALVAYGLARGVRFVPHCEASPNFPYNVEALTTRFNPNSTAADFIDEIDGLGPSGFNGTPSPRFWNAVRARGRCAQALLARNSFAHLRRLPSR